MSNIAASTDWSTGVVSCHCQVVFRAGSRIPPGLAGGGAGPWPGAGGGVARSPRRSIRSARLQLPRRWGLARRSRTEWRPGARGRRRSQLVQRRLWMRRESAARWSTTTTSLGAPPQRLARRRMASTELPGAVIRPRAHPRPVSSSACFPLADGIADGMPGIGGDSACARPPRAAACRPPPPLHRSAGAGPARRSPPVSVASRTGRSGHCRHPSH